MAKIYKKINVSMVVEESLADKAVSELREHCDMSDKINYVFNHEVGEMNEEEQIEFESIFSQEELQ